ncbi:uncharacterized protein LOC62_04G005409 [Vanrija pseudolonga]|uniref:Uncharacterized protein n=1 Tax=Vanrija pseudolonga TaxID=143232 RepID=A0AAF0YDM9_9TREE|nr:hypothetical protein LOC62_04G005409 [Vanrija pseudolonga]
MGQSPPTRAASISALLAGPLPSVIVTPPTPRPLLASLDDYFAPTGPEYDPDLLGYGLVYPRPQDTQVRIRAQRRRRAAPPTRDLDDLCTAQIPGLMATAVALGLPFPASIRSFSKPRTRSHLGMFLTLLFFTVVVSAVLHTQVDTRVVGITMPSHQHKHDYESLVVDLPPRRVVKLEHVIEAGAFH